MKLVSASSVKSFGIIGVALLLCLLSVQSASAAVTLTTATQPPTAVAGTSVVYITGTGFPGGVSAGSVTVSFSAGCLDLSPSATATASGVVHLIGTSDRVSVVVPSSLATGTYAVWVTGSGPAFASATCSTLNVTSSTKKIASCIPSSSLAVSLGPNVTAYVPHGSWDSGVTGIGVVPVEGSGTATTISTTHSVNACSSNSITGETVCTANNTDVYLITGSTLNTTLTSGASGFASFSGGSCQNCGVAIDASNNTAYIEEGLSGGDGIQALNLSTNHFTTPFPMHFLVSENIAIDPNLNYIFSPGEDSNYTVLQIAPDGSLKEFGKSVAENELDSGSEDCTTGIALSSSEFTDDVFIQDMTQAVFTAGSPAGSYTAPGKFQTITPGGFSAGTSGITVAPGSGHLAVVTGEFGGNVYAVLQLPNTSGSGTPSIADWALTVVPANPAGGAAPCASGFSAGLDPHTLTAYTSPNDGKAYGLFSNGVPNCLVRVDLAAIMAAPRGGDGHSVATNPASAYTYYAIP